VVRQWVEADVPALNAAITASVEHLRPWMAWVSGEPETVGRRTERVVRWRRQWEEGGDSVLGVFLDGEPIGAAGLHRRIGEGGVEIGYWIHTDHVGKGYATEATRALTGAAFHIEGIDRAEIHHDKANIPSSRVPEKLGFTLADEKPRTPNAPSEIGIERVWVMTREQWTKRTQGWRPLAEGGWRKADGSELQHPHLVAADGAAQAYHRAVPGHLDRRWVAHAVSLLDREGALLLAAVMEDGGESGSSAPRGRVLG
jgi:RimJ/RimL family protein N-acetyltransferase